MLFRLRGALAIGIASLIGLAACSDGTSGPGETGVGYLAIQPAVSAEIQNGRFSLGVDGIGLNIARPGTGEIVVDTLIPFDADSAAVHAAIRIGMLRRTEQFQTRLTLQDGALVLFSGSKLILLQQGPPGTNGLDSIAVAYEGPGRDIAQIAIQPSDTVVTFGDSTRFRVVAVDSGGSSVSQFFVSWGASDTTVGRLNAFGVLRAPGARGAITVSALTPNGAAASARVTFVPQPTGLRLTAGDTLVAPVGTAASLAARVVAADSQGVRGIAVHFSAATPGGAVTDTVVVSDSTGLAVTQVIVGDTLRNYSYDARAGSLPARRLTVVAVAGPPAALRVIAGDGQSGEVGTQLAQAVAVRVLDGHGNPVKGQRVNFVVVSGGGSVWAGSNNTSDSGVAMERWTLGTSTAAAQRLEARAVDNATGAPLLLAVFSATASPGPADTLERLAGDGQSAAVATTLAESLAVRVTDRYGNPVPDVVVEWAAEQGSVSAASNRSDVHGVSRAAWVMGQLAGAHHATATAVTRSPVWFDATALPGTAAAMTFSAQPTTIIAGDTLPAFAVVIRDAYGNQVSGATDTVRLGLAGLAGASLDGPTSVPTVGGSARFAGLRIRRAGLGYTLRAEYGALLPAGSDTFDVHAGPPASITLAVPATTLTALGAELDLSAVVQDAFGNLASDQLVAWASSDTSVAVVTAGGRVTARRNGMARITAAVPAGVLGFVDLTVAQAVTQLGLVTGSDTVDALGDTLRLTAVARDANDHEVPGAVVTWSSSDPGIATVDPAGLVTSHANGRVTISASAGASAAAVDLTVSQAVATLRLTPEQTTIDAVGASVQLQLDALDHNGYAVDGATVTWASSDTGVASVTAGGLVTAVGPGSVTVTATVSGTVVQSVTLSVAVSVAPTVASVAVTPAAHTFAAIGRSLTLNGAPLDANGNPVADVPVTWQSSDESVAAVTQGGVVTAVAPGSATITAIASGRFGTAAVTVAPVVVVVQVTPDSVTLTAAGDTTRFSASPVDSTGAPVTGATVSWASSDSTVATVDTLGLVTAVANGVATVTATSNGIIGTTLVVVVIPPPPPPPPPPIAASVEVLPPSLTLGALGDTVQLAATVRDSSGNVLAGAPVAWASTDTTVAWVNGSGSVRAAGNGAAAIVALSDGVADTVPVTVNQAAATVGVSPSSLFLAALGQTAVLAAQVRDSNGYEVPGAPVAWTVLGDSAVSVSDSGVVTAVGSGGALVVATSGGVTGSASVIVYQVAAMLEVTPDSSTLTAAGAGIPLTATVRDSLGHVISGLPIAWSSSDTLVAVVDSAGLVVAVAEGAASISATSAGMTASAAVVVAIPSVTLTAIIDVKPGPGRTSINLESDGDTPVAILTTSTAHGEPVTFDAATVVVESVRFAGAPPRHSALEDVDGDGDLDLILQFDTQELELSASSTSATLTAEATDGRLISGDDSVVVTGRSAAPKGSGT